ncbi:MAG: hypothetical protein ACFFDP_10825 [Promethearchaeota archaeon]
MFPDYVADAKDITILCQWIKKEAHEDLKRISSDFSLDAIELLLRVIDNLRFGKKYLDATLELLSRLDSRFQFLTPTTNRLMQGSSLGTLPSPKELTDYLDEIVQKYKELREPNVTKLDQLDEEITARLNEAFHALCEHCYYSTIINCGVALESRLLLILRRRNTKYLQTIDRNLRFTFGQLINTYLQHPHRFHNCIPHRHQKLLELVNSYRTISAHPKGILVDVNTADAVFNLTMKFLIDDDCQPPKRRGPKKKKS